MGSHAEEVTVRQVVRRVSPDRRSAGAARRDGSVGLAPSSERVLALQRRAGNRATVAALRAAPLRGSPADGLSVQRWNPFRRNKGVRRGPSSGLDPSALVVSAPSRGRVMGEKAPEAPARRPQILPLYDYESDPRRRSIFAAWVRARKPVEGVQGGDPSRQFDNTKMTAEILRVDRVLRPFGGTDRPTLEQARAIVAELRASPDPEIHRVVAQQEAKYAPHGRIRRLEDAVASEEAFAAKFGGLAFLGGIAGIVHYMGNDSYGVFVDTAEYAHALGLPAVPEIPSRVGRPELGGDGSGAPPVPSRVGRPELGGDRPGAPPVPSRVGRPELGGDGSGAPPVPSRVGRPELGGDGPGAAPVPSRGPEAPANGSRPAERVTLEPRQDPRRTERKVLDALDRGERVSPQHLAELGRKLGKGQSTTRGREVTAATEAEYAEIASKLTPEERGLLKRAATDYTQDSSRINTLARGGQGQSEELKASIRHNIELIDEAFSALDRKGLTDKRRIVYRGATYRQGQPIPYGTAISVGDIVGEKGYVSTSENRQLLQEGAVERKPGTRFVRFTIIGTGGANISGGSHYTNENAKAMAKLHGLRGPHAVGQAEILFRRGSLFRIESITPAGQDVQVVATRVDPDEVAGKPLKDAFTGKPYSPA